MADTPIDPNGEKPKKYGLLTAKDAAKRHLEEKGKKWDSADWAMEEGQKPEGDVEGEQKPEEKK